jgi:hypothetical protein
MAIYRIVLEHDVDLPCVDSPVLFVSPLEMCVVRRGRDCPRVDSSSDSWASLAYTAHVAWSSSVGTEEVGVVEAVA